jgi:ABC-type Zn uptake system ZnuABC Zn-binding protein ZnuA
VLFILLLVVSACEVNRSGSGTWQSLPELAKPKLTSNTDMGGEFRSALTALEQIKLEPDKPIIAVSTFWDIAYFAGGLSGKVVENRIICSEPTDLYRYKPDKEKALLALKDAHILFKAGFGLDDWIDPIYEEAKLTNPNLVMINISRNITLIGDLWNVDLLKPQPIDKFNPWFWFNPENIMPLADTFYQTFISLKWDKGEEMRKGSDILQGNTAIFPESKKQLIAVQGKKLIQDVPVWSYFCQFYGIDLTATLLKDGLTEPTEEEMKTMADQAKTDGVVAIIKTAGYGNGIADKFSTLSGIPVVELFPHPRMQATGMDDYFQQMMGNTNKLLIKFRELKLPEIEIPEEQAPPQDPNTPTMQVPEDVAQKLKEKAEAEANKNKGEQPAPKEPGSK